ncbi:homogentisate 1,2-dioxygenase [Alteromonas sp. 1_MG-2023]|uniref:homogentisate 1,2-dioxygenase n=1 Tax=Alteromonas sp. 1_MG-2023 TaxID=3062669 RepID=UPI0026E1A66A|nr:homogentisate 1,2-dioxygenase [Alteromonas sp. 1_MG-2023]MDO6567436.1 homogentisate 1,2-dioxygenase [Alteromonas sp. 1_MG-2023]
MVNQLTYLSGFNNEHESEALPNALPKGQFCPQKINYKLYAEQFSSTAFTAPRAENRRSWTYRIRPSVTMGDFIPYENTQIKTAPQAQQPCPPNVMRWDPLPLPADISYVDFVEGLVTIGTSGDARQQTGMGIHYYSANSPMGNKVFYSSDGELLFVPQHGEMEIKTEFGKLHLSAGEIMVIPRGVRFNVIPLGGAIRGYICENYGQPFTLPERGPVGANGFANQRDFLYPTAWFEDLDTPHVIINKFCGLLYQAPLSHSPFDVVAWVGNSAPYKYKLANFNVINTVSFDHPDPSIFTVLTSPSELEGTANVDFVIFPPRWMVAENTFRPPYFHRNVMSEFMGLIKGSYDAKEKGFVPGGMSLHNCFTPHGPEASVFEAASNAELIPQKYKDTLAFMFESRFPIAPTAFALDTPLRQNDYVDCWKGLTKHFDGDI